MKKLILLAVAVVALMPACHNKSDQEPIAQDRMVDFLFDACMLEGMYSVSLRAGDSLADMMPAAYDSVLSRHGLTRDEVEAAFDFYSNRPELFEPIYTQVYARLDSIASTDTTARIRSSKKSIRLEL